PGSPRSEPLLVETGAHRLTGIDIMVPGDARAGERIEDRREQLVRALELDRQREPREVAGEEDVMRIRVEEVGDEGFDHGLAVREGGRTAQEAQVRPSDDALAEKRSPVDVGGARRDVNVREVRDANRHALRPD